MSPLEPGWSAPSWLRRFDAKQSDRPEPISVEDVVDLIGRVAALTRAGLPTIRVWTVLSDAGSPADRVAATVAGMVSAGGTAGEGMRLVAATTGGPAGSAIDWLAVTADIADRSGAPPASVLDGVAAGIRADIADRDARDAALAGPRTTVALLTALPLAGLGLGALMGVDPVAALLVSPAGRVCLLCGCAFWMAGRRWSALLVRRAERAGDDAGLRGRARWDRGGPPRAHGGITGEAPDAAPGPGRTPGHPRDAPGEVWDA